jgi:uncharacterized protein YcgL (UPF0745 family)
VHCFIYKSLKQEGLYLYVLRENDFADVPESLLTSIGQSELAMSLELTPKRQLARADVAQVMQQLQDQGFYVQMPPTKVPASDQLQ